MDKFCTFSWTLINIVLALVFSSFFWGIAPWILFALAATGLMLVALVFVFFEAGFGICIPTKFLKLFKRA